MKTNTKRAKPRKRRRRRKPPVYKADPNAAKARREAWGFNRYRRQVFRKTMRKTKDANLRRRYLIVWHFLEGFCKVHIAGMVMCHRNTVSRVLKDFEAKGELGLIDGRVANGTRKVTEDYRQQVKELVKTQPDACWNHTTWTQELLVEVMAEKTDCQVSQSTMSRLLKSLGARKGMPRPIVGCPWPAWKRQRRLREIRKLIETAPPDEIVLFEDEVDIHLNPKIGADWMLPGQQKTVLTPGVNKKHYVAGAITCWGGILVWVDGPRKRSVLFIELVEKLCEVFSSYKKIHLILDNYIIHKSKITQKAIQAKEGKVQLHFLPPYCPSKNLIERLWKQLHAQVTRNHRCPTIEALMDNVKKFLKDPWKPSKKPRAKVA